MKKNIYTVAIVGCGSIGALKADKYDSPDGIPILTHAHALYNNPRTKLIGVVDTDFNKAAKAGRKWNCLSYKHTDDIPFDPDIWIVAVPTENHFEILQDLLSTRKPKLIIMEKPVCSTLGLAKDMKGIAEEHGTPILVNYTRRFNPSFLYVRSAIRNKEYGNVMDCKITYERGLLRDGSHALDLMSMFFGEFKEGHLDFPKTVYWNDYSSKDLTYSAHLRFEDCPHATLSGINGSHYSIFEVDILLEKIRFSFTNQGMVLWAAIPETSLYGDYDCMGRGFDSLLPTYLELTLKFVVQNAIDYLDGNQELLCTINDAIKVHEIYNHLMKEE